MLHCWWNSTQFNSFILYTKGRGCYQTGIWSNVLGTEWWIVGPYIFDAIIIKCPWRINSFVMVWRHRWGGDVSKLQDVEKFATIRRYQRVLGREVECAPFGNMDQDGHGLSILTFFNHNNLFLGHEGDTWGQEEVIKYLLLGRRHSELPWNHLLWSHHDKTFKMGFNPRGNTCGLKDTRWWLQIHCNNSVIGQESPSPGEYYHGISRPVGC